MNIFLEEIKSEDQIEKRIEILNKNIIKITKRLNEQLKEIDQKLEQLLKNKKPLKEPVLELVPDKEIVYIPGLGFLPVKEENEQK